MSSARSVHDVAQQMENSDNLPCFASLSLNERPVTKGILPRTQSIEVKRDALGNEIPRKKYTQQKHDENVQTMKDKNRDSLWSDFYSEDVRPEKRKNDAYQDKWPPNPLTNGMVPHFLTKSWINEKGGCPDSIEQALDMPEMNKWVKTQNDTIKQTYNKAKSDATKENLEAFRDALRALSTAGGAKGLPLPPGFVHYTYIRNLEINVSDMPSKFFENKYFGPEWKQWNEAIKMNSDYCDMKDANSTRDAWERFFGIFLQEENKRKRGKNKGNEAQQAAEQIHDNQQPQPPSGKNDKDDDDRLVNSFFAQSPQASPNPPPNANELLNSLGPLPPPAEQDPLQNKPPEPKQGMPPEPKGNVPITQDDILNLLQQLPQP